MSKKKKSPVLDMFTMVYDEVQGLRGDVSLTRTNHIKLLRQIEWNLKQAWPSFPGNQYVAQALGLVKGALQEHGEDPK